MSPGQKKIIFFFKLVYLSAFVKFKVFLVIVWHIRIYIFNVEDLAEC